MATKIEWAQETWNPITGCTKISAGCKNCYAERMAKRLRGRFGYPADDPFRVTIHRDKMDLPYSWRKPRRIFPCSMSDLYHPTIPGRWREAVLGVMWHTLRHTYQILTKRPGVALEWHTKISRPLPSNAWLGVTAENQEQADKRIPILLQIPAAKRFVSIEPMLGAINMYRHLPGDIDSGGFDPQGFSISLDSWPGVDWVIVGAETGPGARKMDLNWARSIRDQCQSAGVPFFFKKDSDGNCELDGRLWEEMPE